MDKVTEKLVAALEKEHTLIQERLEEVYKAGIHTIEARRELRSIRDLLFSHLQKEQTEVYDIIRPSLPENHPLQTVLARLDEEMATLSIDILDFFGNHDSEDVSAFHFARDFGSLRIALRRRIREEESRIFPYLLSLQRN